MGSIANEGNKTISMNVKEIDEIKIVFFRQSNDLMEIAFENCVCLQGLIKNQPIFYHSWSEEEKRAHSNEYEIICQTESRQQQIDRIAIMLQYRRNIG